MKSRLFGVFAALSLFVLLALPVSAATPTVSFGTDAWLTNKGQTIVVPIHVTCETAGQFALSADISQTSGRTYASGSGVLGWQICEAGETVTFYVIVTAQTGAFKPGPAEAAAFVYSVDALGENFDTAQPSGTIRLSK